MYFVNCSLDLSGNVLGMTYGPNRSASLGSVGAAGGIGDVVKRTKATIVDVVAVGPILGGVMELKSTRSSNATAEVVFVPFETPQEPLSCGTGPKGPKPTTDTIKYDNRAWRKGKMVLGGLKGTMQSLSAACWVEWQGARAAAAGLAALGDPPAGGGAPAVQTRGRQKAKPRMPKTRRPLQPQATGR
jgi:hypothetical protein